MWQALLSGLLGSSMTSGGAQGIAGQMGQAQGQGGSVGGGQQTPGAPATPGSEHGGGMALPDLSGMLQNQPTQMASGAQSLGAQAMQLTPDVQQSEPSFAEFIHMVDGPVGQDGQVLPPKPSETGPSGGDSMAPGFTPPMAGALPDFANGVAGLPPSQSQPMGMQGQAPQGQEQQPGGFNDLFSLTGTPTDPNMFVKLAEGYNRGGLLGALGYGLTRF